MKTTIHPPLSICEMGHRDNQEDYIYPPLGEATDSDKVFILCDGMGGHAHGEVASKNVADAIANHFKSFWPADGHVDDLLVADAVTAAYDALDACDDGAAKNKKMGTTLTLVVFHEGGCTAAHIGDSRIYHIRPSEHRILYCSRDHSLVVDLYRAGEISFEEMKTSPKRNIITKAMLPHQDRRERPDIVHIGDLQPGDYLYLCSDGMLEQTDHAQLLDLFCSDISDEEKQQRLIEEAADNSDNHSAHLIHIASVERQPDETIADDEASSIYNMLNIKPLVIDSVEEDNETITDAHDKSPHSSYSSEDISAGVSDVSPTPFSEDSQKRAATPDMPSGMRRTPKIWLAAILLLLLAVAIALLLRPKKQERPTPPSMHTSAGKATMVSL